MDPRSFCRGQNQFLALDPFKSLYILVFLAWDGLRKKNMLELAGNADSVSVFKCFEECP
jgi:hypothetical protein